jgi:ribonuclease HI
VIQTNIRESDVANAMIEVYVDGLCEPVNPCGTATFGYVIKRGNATIDSGYGIIGKGEGMTNNVAEYNALIRALERIKQLNLDNEKIIIKSDSKLVVNQMKKSWKTKAPLVLPLFKKAETLVKGMDLVFEWIPREKNTEADELSRSAYESGN